MRLFKHPLSTAFGAYVLLDGIFDIVAAIRSPRHHWALILEGVVGIVAGILTFGLACNYRHGTAVPDCLLGAMSDPISFGQA